MPFASLVPLMMPTPTAQDIASVAHVEVRPPSVNRLVRDATACCASGLDYVLADGQEYPADETDVTVTGEFELYEEDGFFFCQLRGAVLGA